jgi:hypothetical protein
MGGERRPASAGVTSLPVTARVRWERVERDALSHRLAQQHRVVEDEADGPDPAAADECLGIAPVARQKASAAPNVSTDSAAWDPLADTAKDTALQIRS